MGGLGFIALISVLIGAATPTNRRYSGFLGCRFSNSVCLPDERCVNDRLFGSCLRVSRAVGLGDDDASQDDALDDYQYYLDSDTLAKLEREIERLIAHGYTWNNLYTQCVLGNILLAFRMDVQDYDETWCDRGGLTEQQFDEALTDETLAFLEEYFRDYYPSSSSDTDEQLEMPSRRYDPQATGGGDDYVQVHKYLANKRDSGDVDDAWFPDDDVIEDQEGGDDLGSMKDVDQLVRGGVDDATFDNLLSRLNVDDLLSLQSYLRTLDNNRPAIALPDDQQQESYGSDVLGESSVDNDTGSDGFVVGAGGGSFDEGQLAYYPSGPDGDGLDLSSVPDLPISTVDTLLPDRAASSLFDDATDDLLQQEPENEELTQPDAALLSALLRDELSVDDLSDSEVRRLSSHVEWILGVLRSEVEPESLVGDEGNSEGYKMSAIEQEPVPPLILDNSDKAVVDGDSYAADKRAQPSVLEQEPVAAGSSDDAGSVDAHDHSFDTATEVHPTKGPRYEILEADYGNFYLQQKINDEASAVTLIAEIQSMMDLPQGTMEFYSVQDGVVTFRVLDNDRHINASQVLDYAKSHATDIEKRTGLIIVNTGLGRDTKINLVDERANGPKYFVLTFVLCGTIAAVVLAVIAIYIVRQHTRTKEKLAEITSTTGSTEATKDYQDLCRQRMQSKASEKPEPLSAAITRVGSVSAAESVPTPSQTSSHSSTSSWSEEPVVSNMDISTGHIVLSYMEDHLKNKDRLTEEWEALCAYEAEPNAVTVAMDNANARKNRYSDVLPYDHSRVTLSEGTNVSQGNYINASTITDHDPRNPAYIATQGPLPHTVADFWQMIWEQGSVVIVMLTRTTENGVAMCHRYWPEEGSDLYHIYEVHLVSEHIWCDDYLVRSFFLKNLQTNETRTVTQFHFLTWQDLGVPGSVKALLDFRRKVNKSYRGRSCPIVIHCSDGAGRTGTYCLTDMVLNRMSKGAKEIDIAATLEHIRDQRMMMVKTKEQFEFALSSVAEEVHAILKALPQ